jgi:hypothetical protein
MRRVLSGRSPQPGRSPNGREPRALTRADRTRSASPGDALSRQRVRLSTLGLTSPTPTRRRQPSGAPRERARTRLRTGVLMAGWPAIQRTSPRQSSARSAHAIRGRATRSRPGRGCCSPLHALFPDRAWDRFMRRSIPEPDPDAALEPDPPTTTDGSGPAAPVANGGGRSAAGAHR